MSQNRMESRKPGLHRIQYFSARLAWCDPRQLRVWRVGFKELERAGNVQELAELIHKPPPLPKMNRLRRKPWAKIIYGIGLLMFLMGVSARPLQ
jgi:hypothetical protein